MSVSTFNFPHRPKPTGRQQNGYSESILQHPISEPVLGSPLRRNAGAGEITAVSDDEYLAAAVPVLPEALVHVEDLDPFE